MNRKITISAAIFMISLLAFLPFASAQTPGGGVWFVDGEENVVLWKSVLSEYGTDDYGESFDIPKRTSHIRFKAESVKEGNNAVMGNFVNVTGTYYERDGNAQPAPDYQNSDAFSPWMDNQSFYVNI